MNGLVLGQREAFPSNVIKNLRVEGDESLLLPLFTIFLRPWLT